jgi:hypothetical protein
VTDHYVNYPIVLVRLSQLRIDELRDLLHSAWRFVASKKSRIAGSAKPKNAANGELHSKELKGSENI